MKEGSTSEVLGKTITKFIVQNPKLKEITHKEYTEMLAMIGASSLYSQTKKQNPQVQKYISEQYIDLFKGIFNHLVDTNS